MWFEFKLAQVFKKKVFIGWGATCPHHADKRSRRQCKKQLAFGKTMTPDEAKHRIKLWCVNGRGIPKQKNARRKHLAEPCRDEALWDPEMLEFVGDPVNNVYDLGEGLESSDLDLDDDEDDDIDT
jgi:hypothetical protein